MKRSSYVLLFMAVLWMASTDFSGCGKSLNVSAGGKNASDSAKFKSEPDVTFKDLNGNKVTLESLKGKVVFVDFWQTSCEPCRVEIPWLIEFQQKYASKGFTVLGVATDEDAKTVVAPFVEKTLFDVNGQQEKFNYPIVLADDDLADKFGGLIGFPTNYLISRDGRIHKRYIGLSDYDELNKEIQSLL
jgi:thiol-disulfide isomerase/thioredoxin